MKHNLKPQKNIINKPTLDLLLHIPKSKVQKFEAILDTGYSGSLCISKQLAQILNLEYAGKVKNLNVDNTDSLDDLYKVRVEFPSLDLKDTKFIVNLTAKENFAPEMLIGQKLLNLFAHANNVSLVLDYCKNEIYFTKEA